MFSFRKTILVVSSLISIPAIAQTIPDCVNDKSAVRYRIGISLGNRKELIGCESADGTQVFVRSLDQNLKTIATPLIELSPQDGVEIYRPVPAEKDDTKLVLVWSVNLTPEFINTPYAAKTIACKKDVCSVGPSKCLAGTKLKAKLKNLAKDSAKGQGVEHEENSEERTALKALIKTHGC